MAKVSNIHWFAPTTMVASLFCGVLLSIGHHLFYASLDKKTVLDEPALSYNGKQLTQQQFNTSIGTAFARIVGICMTTAISTAYIQMTWTCILRAKQHPLISDMDWATAALSNMFISFNLRRGWRYPALVALAALFWCVPVAMLFPPATISIKLTVGSSTEPMIAPQLDFTTLKYLANLITWKSDKVSNTYYWTWVHARDPSQILRQTTLAVMLRGEILPIAPPAMNSTWTQQFWGPALACNELSSSPEKDAIWGNMWEGYVKGIENEKHQFMSWVPTKTKNFGSRESTSSLGGESGPDYTESDKPFLCNQTSCTVSKSFISDHGTLSLFLAMVPGVQRFHIFDSPATEGPAVLGVWPTKSRTEPKLCSLDQWEKFYEALNCSSTGVNWEAHRVFDFAPSNLFQDATLVRCDMLNTSYVVDYNYTTYLQDIRVSTNTTGESPLVRYKGNLQMFRDQSNPKHTIAGRNEHCAFRNINSPPGNWSDDCVLNAPDLRLMSYQGIMTAFNQFIVGSEGHRRSTLSDGNITSTVSDTVLSWTKEFQSIRTAEGLTKLQEGAFYSSGDVYDVIADDNFNLTYPWLGGLPSSLPIRGGLAETTEQLFQNLTISLMSQRFFHPNYQSPYAPPNMTNVTITEAHNIYTYDRRTLWAAYGTSIAIATLAVIVGLLALFLNNASYSSDFSTYLRISRTAKLTVEVDQEDGTGCDPLPTYLKKARIDIVGAASRSSEGHAMVDLPTSEEGKCLVASERQSPHQEPVENVTERISIVSSVNVDDHNDEQQPSSPVEQEQRHDHLETSTSHADHQDDFPPQELTLLMSRSD